MRSTPIESSCTNSSYHSSDDDDDDLMVSFPSGPRRRIDHGRNSDSSRSENSSTTGTAEAASKGAAASQARRQSKKSDSVHSECIVEEEMSESIKDKKMSSSLGLPSESSSQIVSVQAEDSIDVRSSISCSATSEETSMQHDSNLRVEKKSSKVTNDGQDDSSDDSSSSGSSSSESSAIGSEQSQSSESGTTGSEQSQSSESEATESKHSLSQSEEVLTSGGIPYPTAAKLENFYGWGQISESNYSQDGSYYGSSIAASMKSNRELHVGFSNQKRCDASLTESQASRSIVEDALVEDEYDPKRPWIKKPTQLDQKSEESVAMSALSGSDSGSIFIGIAKHQSNSKKMAKGEMSSFADAKSDTGKSVKSTWSSLNSDLSDLKIAKEALRKGAVGFSGVPRRPVQPRTMSILSESEFTLTTQAQSYRKQEPFRPGPSGALNKSESNSTLEMFHSEAHKSLGVPVQNPPARSHLRTFSTTSFMSHSSLPSISENRDPSHHYRQLNQGTTSESDMNEHEKQKGPRVSFTFGVNLPRSEDQESDKFAGDEDFRGMERGMSAITMPDVNESEMVNGKDSPRSSFSNQERSNSDEFGSSFGSLNTEDYGQLLKSAELLNVGHDSALARVEEGDDEALDDDISESPQLRPLEREQGLSRNINKFESGRYLLQGMSGPEQGLSRNINKFDSDRYLLQGMSGTGLDLSNRSVADSSSDEDEARPMPRMNSMSVGFRQARNSVSHRRSTFSSKCKLCCIKVRQACGRCSCLNKRRLSFAGVGVVIVGTVVALTCLYVIQNKPGSNQKRPQTPNELTQGSSPTKSPSELIQGSSPTKSPSSQPTQLFTLWPTSKDTYSQKYPRPP